MSVPLVNLLETAHGVGVLDQIASPRIVDRALQSADLSRKLLRSGPAFIPMRNQMAMMESVARSLGTPSLGLQVGDIFGYNSYGGYAQFVLGAPTLGEALKRGQMALPYLHPFSQVPLRIRGDYMLFGYVSGLNRFNGSHHADQAAVPILSNVFRHFLGPDWRPTWIEVSDTPNQSKAELEALYDTPLRYGAAVPAMAAPVHVLSAPNPSPETCATALTIGDLPRVMGVSGPTDLVGCVYEMLRLQLHDGDLSIERVSEHLALGPRTLQRRLAEKGLSFRDVRAQVIRARACSLLRETSLSVNGIANALGYAEPNSFRRAFRSWTGQTPQAYRAGARSLAPSATATAAALSGALGAGGRPPAEVFLK